MNKNGFEKGRVRLRYLSFDVGMNLTQKTWEREKSGFNIAINAPSAIGCRIKAREGVAIR